MRTNQFSVRIERFSDQAENGIREKLYVYSDGNDFTGVLARGLEEIRRRYFPDMSRKEFYDSLLSVDTEESFFGRCESGSEDK